MTVPAAFAWKTNGDLIAAVAELGYLRSNCVTLDCTYGEGVFWKKWRPSPGYLIGTDLVPRKCLPPMGPSDFTRLPFRTNAFGAVVFDPPYKLNGTPNPETDERYGVDVPMTWQERHALIRAGMDECYRCLSRRGYLLLKCQDQVSSGKVRWQTDEFTAHAASLGLKKVDRLDMLGTSREQPGGRRQVHAHGRPSTLLVFQK